LLARRTDAPAASVGKRRFRWVQSQRIPQYDGDEKVEFGN
jgi:hypothetical protein